jgi:3-hydroxyacyl-CoA dehydrogenase/enoyl-CoA hydratase/3-hydroxybutyryl-CoA epimerase
MSAAAVVSYKADADGVGWIVFDDPERRANVFNAAMQDALDAALDRAAGDVRLKALILKSGKEGIFIAGADLKVLAALPDEATAMEFSRRGQQLFQRLADSRVPVIGAIHGACVGGGYELALACHWRIASDAGVTNLGLPETAIGTIPGWGGSVRLPRLIGVKPALDHMLKAQLLPAAEARERGLVNEVVPVHDLKERAKTAALRLAAEERPAPSHAPALLMPAPEPGYFFELRELIRRKSGGHHPALLAAIDVVEQSSPLPMAEALEVESRIFGEVAAGVGCKNRLYVFSLREAARKRTLDGWFPMAGAALRRDTGDVRAEHHGARPLHHTIQRVGVVGAGVMGSGIAQWLAAHGLDVVLRDVEPEIVERGLAVARALFDEAVKRGKLTAGAANSGLRRIATTTGWDGFETCDLVIEAIVEDTTAKQALFTELASVVAPDTILASNTSALPIEEIAGQVPRSERILGIHFFNPVSRMTLVELIVGRHTSAESAARALALVNALGKSPIICRSSPGFLVTRVLFLYLNEAVRLWEDGVSAGAMDGALRDFGWPMGPLRLIDEVGVDVTDLVFAEMEHYFPARFARTTTCGRIIAAGMRGRKNGMSCGFYRYEGRSETSNEVELARLVPRRTFVVTSSRNGTTGEDRDIVAQLMRVMADEAERCLEEGVVKSADDVDFALLSGAGFPAFRGGLLRWSRQMRTQSGRAK